MLQSIDVGLLVLDRQYNVQLWNSFMANHSGISSSGIIGKNIFQAFSDVPETWFKRKVESVFLLNNRAFTTWEQRPYLFNFKNYRPITGSAEFMYQNITYIPLASVDGKINHLGIAIYDVTDIAINKSELEEVNHKLEVLSRTDRLTNLNNRGHWEECLVQEFLRVQRTKRPSSLIMFDIDHFKKVNDSYGHQAGDEVIRAAAAEVVKKVRVTDVPGRYGGEEFGIILIDTPAEGALYLAERLRKAIEAMSVFHDGVEIRYTISLGIAEIKDDMSGHKQWLQCADQALYEAKRAGRNQSVIYK
ncbi:MAG: GGDEF domain-containing protein [Gammaproteobacteria bacterium]|nr:GGDEF domain-containing protein [Gammaproteobacteria bacterium]